MSAATSDPYDLQRFAEAQRGTYERALAEIGSGRKRSHWMWYIFPQLAGLGRSQMAQRYAITGADEARAYLAHPLLGERLRRCVAALQDLTETTTTGIFGEVDAMKLRSSLTLFAEASGELLFSAALQRWFAGEADERTLVCSDAEHRHNGSFLASPKRPLANVRWVASRHSEDRPG